MRTRRTQGPTNPLNFKPTHGRPFALGLEKPHCSATRIAPTTDTAAKPKSTGRKAEPLTSAERVERSMTRATSQKRIAAERLDGVFDKIVPPNSQEHKD